MAVTTSGRYYYKNNDDVVTAVAQCGDYIREHAGDLIGRVVGDKPRDIMTDGIRITIAIDGPETIPTITVYKNTLLPLMIPFEEE